MVRWVSVGLARDEEGEGGGGRGEVERVYGCEWLPSVASARRLTLTNFDNYNFVYDLTSRLNRNRSL